MNHIHAVDMSERCIMCGASERSFSHPDYADWVRITTIKIDLI